MNLNKICMSFLLLVTYLNSGVVLAQSEESLYGTNQVYFEPSLSNGELKSCALVYQAVQPDHRYKNGKPILIVGNIGVSSFNSDLIYMFKIGIKDLDSQESQQLASPNFAYLQVGSKTTVKFQQKSMDGDNGFRLIAFQFNESSSKFITEMIDSGMVTIGFNRSKNGLDVLVPIDLRVSETTYSESSVIRKRSDVATNGFTDCYLKLIKQTLTHANKQP